MSFEISYFYYHPFIVGDIGIRFSQRGLMELDISQIYRDRLASTVQDSAAKHRWKIISTEIIDLAQLKDATLNDILTVTIAELIAYFSGSLKVFTAPIYFDIGTPFQRTVWHSLQTIPYGEVVSYKAIAERIGNANAVRAVGGANGKNPLPIMIPCHRVIQANGALGGYSGGVHIKQALLTLEGLPLFSEKS